MMKKTPLALMAGTLLAATASVMAQPNSSGEAPMTGTVSIVCGMDIELGDGRSSLDVSSLVDNQGAPTSVGFDIYVYCNHIDGAKLSVESDNGGLKGLGAVDGEKLVYNIAVDSITGDSETTFDGQLTHGTYADLVDEQYLRVDLSVPAGTFLYAGDYTDKLTFSIAAGT